MANRTWRRSTVSCSLVVSLLVAPLAAASDPVGGERAVPAPATASPKPLVIRPAIEAALQSADPVAEWQAEIAVARAKRSSARKQQYSGLGVAIGGYVLMVAGAAHGDCRYGGYCGPGVGLAWAGLGTLVMGTTMGIRGKIRASDADGEVNALLTRGPQKSFTVSLGTEKSIGYRVTW